MTEDFDTLCICGHAKRKHGDWIGDCFAFDGQYATCPCEKFQSVNDKPEIRKPTV